MPNSVIDDQDLSRINYKGEWVRGGNSRELDGTVASSTRVGDSFVVSFYGNAIAVYGTIDDSSAGVQSNYSIDGADPQTATSQGGAGDTPNQQFWKSPTLTLGQHALDVTMVKVNKDPQEPTEGTIWFDYFAVTDPTIRPLKRKVNVGAVVGGLIGGFALLALLVLLFFWRRRKRRDIKPQPLVRPKVDDDGISNSLQTSEIPRTPQSHSTVMPFTLYTDPNHTNASSPPLPSKYTRLQVSELDGQQSRINPPSDPSSTSGSVDAYSSPESPNMQISPTSKLSRPPAPSVDTRQLPSPSPNQTGVDAVRHVDSGVRNLAPSAITIPFGPVELPPVYSAV
ncbi:hypothetical protein CPB83DRAFT_904577 [Crepidotus variabilis]|uniref:Uncharacterized protein n=1 Tax=Crepidotus variabilis TaxID=179855 RepID=A0A9P6JT46_9AGAR|nr:hypothetical protein CPB83DRAFT_904577 [Crepidotus variabilis]